MKQNGNRHINKYEMEPSTKEKKNTKRNDSILLEFMMFWGHWVEAAWCVSFFFLIITYLSFVQ